MWNKTSKYTKCGTPTDTLMIVHFTLYVVAMLLRVCVIAQVWWDEARTHDAVFPLAISPLAR